MARMGYSIGRRSGHFAKSPNSNQQVNSPAFAALLARSHASKPVAPKIPTSLMVELARNYMMNLSN